jgi:PLP dependent protein
MTRANDPTVANSVVARLAEVRERISRAARDCGRDPGSVTLVCVSKTFEADAILPALEAGERVFGENRVQEAQGKWPALRERFPGLDLHLIGPLQSNKAEDAVALFDTIETVDRPKIAAEPQKAGVLPEEADAFLASCREEHGLTISGLMCIPPVDEQASPHFALLAKIAARNGIAHLSMGMSADFELGIQLGATHVRVGSAIFGAR